MAIRTINVPCHAGLDLRHLLDTALALARPFGAHIDVTCVLPDPATELAMLPSNSVDADLYAIPALEKAIEENRARQEAIFEDWCQHHEIGHEVQDHRLDSVFAHWSEARGPIEAVVMQRGRLADLTVVRKPTFGDVAAARCFDAAVFSTGRPTLVVPETPAAGLLRHVIVAWNGSLESTHALAGSMDILHAAEEVSIFTAPRDGDEELPARDLAAALRWHGIQVRCPRQQRRAEGVGAALLATAEDLNASLIVMGAYTHSRVREALLGGVTREVLRSCSIPVIMAH